MTLQQQKQQDTGCASYQMGETYNTCNACISSALGNELCFSPVGRNSGLSWVALGSKINWNLWNPFLGANFTRVDNYHSKKCPAAVHCEGHSFPNSNFFPGPNSCWLPMCPAQEMFASSVHVLECIAVTTGALVIRGYELAQLLAQGQPVSGPVAQTLFECSRSNNSSMRAF